MWNYFFLGTKEVLYAGDIQSAKEEVNAMIRYLGFTPVDRGSLRNAREIEDVPVQRFPNWKNPLIISCLVFGMYILIILTENQHRVKNNS